MAALSKRCSSTVPAQPQPALQKTRAPSRKTL